MAETHRQMAWRHLIEGYDRIVRQELLIDRLVRDGHAQLLPAARQVLAELLEYQEAVRKHLDELDRRTG
jgi:hypothetical protein